MGKDPDLATDVLEGAAAIAAFFFGDPKKRRQIYELAENKKLPVFRMGTTICARKSTLLKWIEKQEVTSRDGERRQG